MRAFSHSPNCVSVRSQQFKRACSQLGFSETVRVSTAETHSVISNTGNLTLVDVYDLCWYWTPKHPGIRDSTQVNQSPTDCHSFVTQRARKRDDRPSTCT